MDPALRGLEVEAGEEVGFEGAGMLGRWRRDSGAGKDLLESRGEGFEVLGGGDLFGKEAAEPGETEAELGDVVVGVLIGGERGAGGGEAHEHGGALGAFGGEGGSPHRS